MWPRHCPEHDPRDVGRNALASAANDPAALQQLVRGPVVNGGLWFEDAKCSTEFSKPGDVPDGRQADFARCLATLHLQASGRDDQLGDVVVMKYPPGFEVEARVVPENNGPRLTWIGYESRRSDKDNAPTITPAALEALRVSGDPMAALDPAVAATLEIDPNDKASAAYSWLKVCIDDAGAVSEVHVHETTSVKAAEAFSALVRTWKFRPFTMEDQPIPVCAMLRLAYPYGQGPTLETLPVPPPPSRSGEEPIVFTQGPGPHKLLEGHRISGNKTIIPDDDTKGAIADSHLGRVQGTFRLCLDTTGKPESIVPLRSTGFAAYNRRILGTMNAWRYSPYEVDDRPVPICTSVTFIYSQR